MELKSIGVTIAKAAKSRVIFGALQFPKAALAAGETEKINRTSAMTCRQGVFLL